MVVILGIYGATVYGARLFFPGKQMLIIAGVGFLIAAIGIVVAYLLVLKKSENMKVDTSYFKEFVDGSKNDATPPKVFSAPKSNRSNNLVTSWIDIDRVSKVASKRASFLEGVL